MKRISLPFLFLAISFCGVMATAQSVADAAKASKNAGTSAKVIDEDDLASIRSKAHVSNESLSNNGFCDSGCQDEVRSMLLQKTSADTAELLLTDGLNSAREDGSWQELIGRVQTAVCAEKKTGTPAVGDAALQKEVLLKITQEQKQMAELQDRALRTSNPTDVNSLKQQSAKLMVIGIGLKRIASGSNCGN